jgi:hypothetical protein
MATKKTDIEKVNTQQAIDISKVTDKVKLDVLAKTIRAEMSSMLTLMKKANDKAILLGNYFTEAQALCDKVKPGSFVAWVCTTFEAESFDYNAASRCMRVARAVKLYPNEVYDKDEKGKLTYKPLTHILEVEKEHRNALEGKPIKPRAPRAIARPKVAEVKGNPAASSTPIKPKEEVKPPPRWTQSPKTRKRSPSSPMRFRQQSISSFRVALP